MLVLGQSKDIKARWRKHVTCLKNKRTHYLQSFIQWYHENGATEDLLDFRILEKCKNTDQSLNLLECYWFDELNPRFFGKKPSVNESWVHSQIAKNNISKGLKIYWEKQPHKQKEVHKRKSKLEDIDKITQIINPYIEGQSLRKISKELNISHITIRSILIENNVKLRGHSSGKPKQFYNYSCIVCSKSYTTEKKHVKTCGAPSCRSKYGHMRKSSLV